MKASDCKCCVCKSAQAVAFWPCVDPDVRSHPYCRACLDKAQNELLIKIAEMEHGQYRVDYRANRRGWKGGEHAD